MAKRTTLSQRREGEVRGTDVLFGTASPVESAEPALETTTNRPALAKVTLYIRPDQVLAIEQIQLDQRQKTGNKPDKSDLVQEALDLLTEKYNQA